MEFRELSLAGFLLIKPRLFEDERGLFFERYNRDEFRANGVKVDFVQDNFSRSARGVLRGLHFQIPPFAQDKLVWVTRGEVFDVAVDLRRSSPSFGKWEGRVLSAASQEMLFLPAGFAHGFVVLSESADFSYKTSSVYSSEHDRGLLWNDPEIGVEWPEANPVLSVKDRDLPTLRKLVAAGDVFS